MFSASGKSGGGGSSKKDYIAVSWSYSPYIRVYPWSSSGYGAAFSNPATLPPGTAGGNPQLCLSVNSDGTAIAVGGTDSGGSNQYVIIYRFSSSGFGTTYYYNNAFGIRKNVCFSKDGTLILIGNTMYAWSSAGLGSAYSGTIITNGAVDIHPLSTGIVTSTGPSDNYIKSYPFSKATGIGSAYSDPSAPTGTIYSCNFVPQGDAVIVTQGGFTNGIRAYTWGAGDGIRYLYSSPSARTNLAARAAAVNTSGDTVFFACENSPYIAAYPWNSSTGYGTQYADPAVLPSSYGTFISVNKAGNAVALATNSGGGWALETRAWSASGWGSKYSDPSTGSTINAAQGVQFFQI
jgi:hypothetical protein